MKQLEFPDCTSPGLVAFAPARWPLSFAFTQGAMRSVRYPDPISPSSNAI